MDGFVEAPRIDVEGARTLAESQFGFRAESVVSLPSYCDSAFKLVGDAGETRALKIANPSWRDDRLLAEIAVLNHLCAAGAPAPKPLAANDGSELAVFEKDGRRLRARMFTWLDGALWADEPGLGNAFREKAGRFFGRLDASLQELGYVEALDRPYEWDLQQALRVRDRVNSVDDAGRRALVEGLFDRFEAAVAPVLSALPRQVIHGDGNEYNLLVRDGEVCGLLDFGDLAFAPKVCELAIVAAYAALSAPDPLAAVADILRGYHEVNALEEREAALVFDLARTRLTVSVVMAAWQSRKAPDNDYIGVTTGPAWRVLERWNGLHPTLATAHLRAALGWEPHPRAASVRAAIARAKPAPLAAELTGPRLVFEMDPGGAEAADPDGGFSGDLFARMAQRGARIGLGRYNEPRRCYVGPNFQKPDESPRTLHIGVDLFLPPGTPLCAPFDAVVHSFADNAAPYDYGPTILLRHQLEDVVFYSLHGHLSRDSLEGLTVGQAVAKGQPFARVGSTEVNGGWPPHLHFQLIVDALDRQGDFPGVVVVGERDVWLSLCPDPNLVLRLDEPVSIPRGRPAVELARLRRAHLGPMLSLSYQQPLKIVRGKGARLYDEDGGSYLDMVNNVCHVGHCHPRVVAAAQRQIAALNTNTRYLHDHLVVYALRLTDLLPEPLRVCFFTCTGSEANDLALRMARAHTGGGDMVCLEGAYHGHTHQLIGVSPYKHDGPGGQGRPGHVHAAPMPDSYRGPYKRADPECGRKYADHVAEACAAANRSGRRLAALICEPMLGCGGQIEPPPGFLRQAFAHARAAGGVCVADEVQIGFGRVGSHMWAFEAQGAVPDIVTLGKPIGNGHPLAAVVTTPEIAASFDNGMEYFNTFGGNPVSCAVGLAALDVIRDEGLQERALRVGGFLKQGLEALARDHALIGDVRGSGLFLGVELVRDRQTLEPADREADRVVNRMRERGVLLSTDGPLRNVIKIKPPLVFSQADAQEALAKLDDTFRELGKA